MTMVTPDDPGSGRLFFWSRQGISLQELYRLIADAVAASDGSGSGGSGGVVVAPIGPIQSTDIDDATDVGIAVLTAAGATFADRQAAARNAIGAGTGSGTVAYGNTAGTAAEGDKALFIAGDQTITGMKSVTDPTLDPQIANKRYVDTSEAALMATYGVKITKYIDYTTGTWPTRSTGLPAGYSTWVTWYSLGYSGTAIAPPTAIDGDLWERDYA